MVPEMNRVGEEIGLGGGLEKALLLFFLAADTVASPRNSFQSFLLHVLLALHDQMPQFFLFLEQPLPVLLDSSLVHGASLKLRL